MTVEGLTAWLLAIMLGTVPPGSSRRPDEARETAAEGKTRYAAIAHAIAAASLDPAEAPVLTGPRARERTAALLLALSLHESHWRRDVDLGIGPLVPPRGRYWCLLQIAVDRGKSADGATAAELVASRDRCFRSGLHALQRAQRACAKKNEPWGFLNLYASGYCDRGRKAVAIRRATWERLLREHPFPADP